MSAQVDIFALIVVFLFLLIAVFLIPTLLHLKNTLQKFDQFVGEAQRDVLPMLRELREISEKVNRASDDAGKLMESLGEVGDTIHSANKFLHHDVGRLLGNAAGFWLGIRGASKAFSKAYKQKGGG